MTITNEIDARRRSLLFGSLAIGWMLSATGCGSGSEPPFVPPNGGAGGAVGTTDDCSLTVTSALSPAIPTVGIVEFTTDGPRPESASIEFGLDTRYGLVAPVELDEPRFRTLLLGMKPSRDYHYRLVVSSGGAACKTRDYTLSTGPLPNGLPNLQLTTTNPTAAAGGYLLVGTRSGSASILDADGSFVWSYGLEPSQCHGAAPDWQCSPTVLRMSIDGKAMWMADVNVPQRPANVHRVSMDGLVDLDLSDQFADLNHDLSVLPDETVVFLAYGSNGCDDIKQRSPDGVVTTIANSGTILGTTDCHCNAVQYSRFDDTLVFSDLISNSYAKITRQGAVVWILGGSGSDFTGDGAAWVGQHNLHILGADRLLFFNNEAAGAAGGSRAVELSLDLATMSARRVFEYAADPAIENPILGDVQRLENGNTLVTYSFVGVIQEVSPEGSLVQELRWPIGSPIGYGEKRRTLYGPPPKLSFPAR